MSLRAVLKTTLSCCSLFVFLDMLNSKSTIDALYGVGDTLKKALNKMGINTLEDLIRFYPRTYEDLTKIENIKDTINGSTTVIKATILSEPTESYTRQKNMLITRCLVGDKTGVINLIFFNNKYIKSSLKYGVELIFKGKIEKSMIDNATIISPTIYNASYANTLYPVYKQVKGIKSNKIKSLIETALKELLHYIKDDVLPVEIRQKFDLITQEEALNFIHNPKSFVELEKARKRLVFEELLTLELAIRLMKQKSDAKKSVKIDDYTEEFISSLDFSLTNAQLKAIKEASLDMQNGENRAMTRLIQGDVGSGKTAVSMALCYSVYKNKMQSAVLAPTEILASQHFSSFNEALERFGTKILLLTSSLKGKKRKDALEKLASGYYDIVIGTHSILTSDVVFSNLALAITDEQHRFGVLQRNKLTEKGDNPHILVMSATPIPRTLALIIYGDLDVSIINEMPAGRQKINTYAIKSSVRQRVANFMLDEIKNHHQCYIVCAAIEEGEDNVLGVLEYYETVAKNLFSTVNVKVLHGKLSSKEKNEIIQSFYDGECDILISTTVVEVGVNVPNATVMLIENAERFGLSTLHQLRGRVGRGSDKSYCILVSDSKSEATVERLKCFVSSNDGFTIAENDLRLRGPGDFFGSEQHGLPPLAVLKSLSDSFMLESANEALKMLENLEHDKLKMKASTLLNKMGESALN